MLYLCYTWPLDSSVGWSVLHDTCRLVACCVPDFENVLQSKFVWNASLTLYSRGNAFRTRLRPLQRGFSDLESNAINHPDASSTNCSVFGRDNLSSRWVFPKLKLTRIELIELISTIEFSLNFIKLATLAVKAYVGKSKINSARKLHLVRVEHGTLGLLLWHILYYTLLPTWTRICWMV